MIALVLKIKMPNYIDYFITRYIVIMYINLTTSVSHFPCRLEGNPELCRFSSCNPKEKKKILLPVIASVASVLVLVVVVALFFVFRKKKVPSGKSQPI